MASFNTVRDDSLKYYSMVARLIHYTSKFTLNDDARLSKQYSTTRNRLSSNLDSTDKFVYSNILAIFIKLNIVLDQRKVDDFV